MRTRAAQAAVHQRMGRLQAIADHPGAELETSSLVADVQEILRATIGAESSSVWVRLVAKEPDLVAAHGTAGDLSPHAVRRCLALGRPSWRKDTLALPLRIRDEVFGVVALSAPRRPDPALVTGMQQTLDEHAVRLDAALFVDRVRESATAEERRRLAREIHDGVAQRIVALGYLADDVAALVEDAEATEAIEVLREQITRVAGDLRLSVVDLRTDEDFDLADGISDALSAYVGEIGRSSDLRVHVYLDERGARPSSGTGHEVLKIAQEAISNTYQHAHATNLWLSLTSNGQHVRLVVEDDGIGQARPRRGHFGLQGMRERAARIGAELDLRDRREGGTVVTLQTKATTAPTDEGNSHDNQGLARR